MSRTVRADVGDIQREFGRRVEWYRIKSGWSRHDLALKSGVDASTLWRIETGRSEALPPTIRKIADAFREAKEAGYEELIAWSSDGTYHASQKPTRPNNVSQLPNATIAQGMDCIDELSPGAQRPVRAVIRLLTGFDEAEQRAWAEEQIRKLSGM